jgi:hypothetical protein
MLTNTLPSVIDGLKQEEARLEKIAARFKKSHSIHYLSVLTILDSIKRHIEMLEAGRERNAA